MSTDTITRQAYRVKGSTQDVTTCQLCGREDLRGTIVLAELDEDGNEAGIVYFGASCGAKAAKWTTKEIRSLARQADQDARDAALRAAEKETRRYCNARDAWVIANIGPNALESPRRYGYRSSYAIVVAFETATGRR